MTEVPHVIGFREYVDLPAWGIEQIKAKADTGARSSAIDASQVEEFDGGKRVRFKVRLSRVHKRWATLEADVKRRTRIKSSTGHACDRLTVETTIRIGPVEKTIELGLVNRRTMICRMLLGRRVLAGDFLVDSRQPYLYGRRNPNTNAVSRRGKRRGREAMGARGARGARGRGRESTDGWS